MKRLFCLLFVLLLVPCVVFSDADPLTDFEKNFVGGWSMYASRPDGTVYHYTLTFSRQEHWSGLPFPSPMRKSESEVAQSCPTLRNPMDCSLPGSSAHGIFQARVLEWGAVVDIWEAVF